MEDGKTGVCAVKPGGSFSRQSPHALMSQKALQYFLEQLFFQGIKIFSCLV